ncbi:helix-turn-helix transcriptional regulator [uncultured Treponema sp.]|uniref:helix-turn-helix domain-containing protein n=1 Tax=uncultured Treponema sp. TaxID=162155 RepID=UPI00258B802C|nr:helix-turn-helix transcriptional regulator [uncultured Treponema sp.]
MEKSSEEYEANSELCAILSKNIRAARKNLHLTQERLAENADISLPYLADIEHCKTWVSDKTLTKLAGALNKKPFELLFENPDSPTKTSEKKLADILFKEKKEFSRIINSKIDEMFSKIIEEIKC